MHKAKRINVVLVSAVATVTALFPHPAAALCKSIVPEINFFSFWAAVVAAVVLAWCVITIIRSRRKVAASNGSAHIVPRKYKVAIVASAALLAASASLLFYTSTLKDDCDDTSSMSIQASTFDDCVFLGYPVQNTYPRTCTANRVTYTENVNNVNTPTNTNNNTNSSLTQPVINSGYTLFSSRDDQIRFQYKNDWACSEVVYGKRIDCYPVSRQADLYNAGLDQPIVYMPEISMSWTVNDCGAAQASEPSETRIPATENNPELVFFRRTYHNCTVNVSGGSSKVYTGNHLDAIIRTVTP